MGLEQKASPANSGSFSFLTSLLREERKQESVRRMLEHLRPILRRAATKLVPGALAAKFGESDLIQITLADAFSSFATFKGVTGVELVGWALAILRHNAANEIANFKVEKRNYKRERGEAEIVGGSRELAPDEQAIYNEALLQRWQALERLPECSRTILELRHMAGLSYPEIAEQLSMKEPAVRQQFSRALRQWKKECGDAPNA